MSREYVENNEVEQIAEELIPHMEWRDTPEIKFLMLVADKSIYAGKCSKATGKWKYLTDKDFIIEVWDGFWKTADTKAKEALVYHELKHIDFLEDEETGEIVWKLRRHDVEEFHDVVEKYGYWNEALKEFFARSMDT